MLGILFRTIVRLAVLTLVLLVAKCIWTLFVFSTNADPTHQSTVQDILYRRNYLDSRLVQSHLTLRDMPRLVSDPFRGEWLLVTHSMAATAFANIAFLHPEWRAEAIDQAGVMVERMLGLELKTFDIKRWGEDPLEFKSSKPHLGYLGHLNWALAAYRSLGGTRAKYVDLHRDISQFLIRQFDATKQLCLETYPGERYVPDLVVAVASIAQYEYLNGGERGKGFGGRWLDRAKKELIDPQSGLLGFALDQNCHLVAGARGSGAGWNTYFLPFIDPAFAKQQYQLLASKLSAWRPLPGILEYPRGVRGAGDVDSGPLIFGISPAATGFAVAGATFHGDQELLDGLMFTSEFVGTSWTWNGYRHYLAGMVLGDAIMLAARTAHLWDRSFLNLKGEFN